MSVGGAARFRSASTVCVPAPSVKVSVPVGARAVGANSTCTWQPVFAARLAVPQELLESTNGAVMVRLLMGIAAGLLLATVTCSGGERSHLDLAEAIVVGLR